MSKSKSWSVKGIAPETRDTARDAAQAAGMPIGAWIDSAILKASRGELPGIPVVATESTTDDTSTDMLDDSTGSRAAVSDSAAAKPATTAAEQPQVATPETGASRPPSPGISPIKDVGPPPPKRGTEVRPGIRPLAPAAPRVGAMRYVLAAVVFVTLIGAGGWIFVELSRPDKPQGAGTTAATGATPAVDASPAPATATAPESAAPELPDILRELTRAANAGEARAQHDLGMLYLTGRLVAKNPAEAAKWFEKAAVQGHPNAQFNLGVLYQQGEGVPENQQLAFFWYQSAAEQNYPRAQHNLAAAYAEGRGVALSEAKAVEWFTKAANNGVAPSQHSLGLIFERGYGDIKPDLVAARSWYASAAAQGYTQSAERLSGIDAKLAALPPPTTGEQPAAAAPAVGEKPAADRPLTRSEIREIQALLNKLNFSAGPADGQIGQRTVSAISLYQKFAGFPEDGKATRALLEDLRAVAQAMGTSG